MCSGKTIRCRLSFSRSVCSPRCMRAALLSHEEASYSSKINAPSLPPSRTSFLVLCTVSLVASEEGRHTWTMLFCRDTDRLGNPMRAMSCPEAGFERPSLAKIGVAEPRQVLVESRCLLFLEPELVPHTCRAVSPGESLRGPSATVQWLALLSGEHE